MQVNQGMEAEYNDYVTRNSEDGYSAGVVAFAERWASAMEAQIEQGKKLEEIAEEASNTADTEGITGFMYGCAVSSLRRFWKHGQALGTWHNRKYIDDPEEAERASADGKTVNPAVFTVG